jgi:hypothetical protein
VRLAVSRFIEGDSAVLVDVAGVNEGLWERLKGFERHYKQFLQRDAYIKLKSFFKWKGLPIEFVETDDNAISVEFRERK